jgi:hypothetical protein
MMAAEMDVITDENAGSFIDSLRNWFSAGSDYAVLSEENVKYRRRFLDRRIEAYLDQHFQDYMSDFDLLDEVALDMRTERVNALDARSLDIERFITTIDREVGELESKCDMLEKTRKKK